MSNLIHLIYNSAATHPFSNDELQELLFKSRNKNASVDITGMLLYIDGCFFQVLEGPVEAVDALAAVINNDPRHSKMTVIIREPIARRSFSEWTMGFARMSPDDARLVDGLNDYFGEGHVLMSLDPGRAKKLLTAFGHGRWRVKLSASATATPSAPTHDEPSVEPGAEADPRSEFTFAFQPIVNYAERSIAGYEALVRGIGQEPAAHVLQQLPIAEIGAFDEDGRRKAIGLATRLEMKGNLHLNMVPQSRFDAPNTLDSTIQTALHCGLDPSRIVLEIKHEATVADPLALAEWLRGYRSHGLKISIDDFGSGYAGLALLDHYQPEMISLSMWIVRDIEGHGPRQAILRGLVQTCGDLGIDIVAKGVETVDEFCWLRDEGIELFQGYLFAKPGFEKLPVPMIPAMT